jgi:hypothetical protein
MKAMTETLPLNEMLLDFESFGDNCEFGIIQKQGGAEVLSLLNCGFSPMPSLLRALGNRFSEVSEIDRIQIHIAANKELVVTILDYNFVYHSGKREGDIEIETFRKNERIKLKFLARNMVSILTTGEKIFVRKGQNSKTLDEAKTLLAAMSEYGPATLLWVVEADADHPPGSVELIAPRLLCGRIDRFAPYTDAYSINFSCWTRICRNAHALWKLNAGIGSALRAPEPQADTENLLQEGILARIENDPLPRVIPMDQGAKTTVLQGKHHLRKPGTQTICRHELTVDTGGTVGTRVSGLDVDQPYTLSVWYRPGSNGKLEHVMVNLPGAKHVRVRRPDANLRSAWQRLEVSAIVPENGVMFPRLSFKGSIGTTFETANWRFEKGLVVNLDEQPSEAETFAPLEFKTVEPALAAAN